ncbi:MAG: sigma-70 family RNA polymerase sigma factor [Phycisphaerales bacterium]|jgi:RNA polymerase sigma factor (sigma-70 family)|nr:sigma-70 family RNA polymerase sigma factor [Phycisphaerales bacterium]
MNTLTTTFVRRLRQRDEAAWFELWEVFGPVLRQQLTKWGAGSIGFETVRDLSQETLAQLSKSIDRFDPERGARFSTWLLAIAKHALGDEVDRRMAQKRGGGRRPTSLDDRYMVALVALDPDKAYEQSIFCAKVYAAIRATEADSNFVQFQVYRMGVLDGMSGKNIAKQLEFSEPTVSRYANKVRIALRARLKETMERFSFTDDEATEADRAGLVSDDKLFDEAIADIYHQQSQLLVADEQFLTGS